MSQPTQPLTGHPVTRTPPINQPYNEQAPLPPLLHRRRSPAENVLYQTPHPQRMNEDLFPNIVLVHRFASCSLSCCPFITSATSLDRRDGADSRPRVSARGRCLYGAGLLTTTFVKRLRIASFLYGDRLGSIPSTGIAVILGIWDQGRFIWLITSLIGTPQLLACTLMRNRVMGYLPNFFLYFRFVGRHEGG